jgi:hypothetical protein
VNQARPASAGKDAAPPQPASPQIVGRIGNPLYPDRVLSGPLGRRAVLQGLGALILGGCCTRQVQPAKPSAVVSPSPQDPSRPKTVGEFVKQPPPRLPFSDKE